MPGKATKSPTVSVLESNQKLTNPSRLGRIRTIPAKLQDSYNFQQNRLANLGAIPKVNLNSSENKTPLGGAMPTAQEKEGDKATPEPIPTEPLEDGERTPSPRKRLRETGSDLPQDNTLEDRSLVQKMVPIPMGSISANPELPAYSSNKHAHEFHGIHN